MQCEIFRQFVLQFTVIISAYTDVLWLKVPNVITFPAVVCGLVISGIQHGTSGVIARLFGILILFVIGTLGIMGMGDLKLWMALTTLSGIQHGSYAIFAGAAMLAVYILMIRPSDLLKSVRYAFGFFRRLGYQASGTGIISDRTGLVDISETSDTVVYPFAFFVLLGYPLVRSMGAS